jgi:DNA (cytosine-5)-methyltransferase 1
MKEQPTAIDLFSGAGGLSLGFERAGFLVVPAYDNWTPAVDTYRANFSHTIHQVDITEELDLQPPDVIFGGPPCQGFSSAGMRRDDDHRNTLITVFAQLVARIRPPAFLFENVEGFLTGSRGRFVLELLSPLIDAGYRIHLRKVNAANYGVPQHRKRVIAVGGLGWDPSFPPATHSAYGAPGAQLASRHLPRSPSLAEAIADLPPAVPDDNGVASSFDHGYTPLGADDLQRAVLLAPGRCMRDLPQELWHKSYQRRAYRRVMDGTPSERRGGPPAGLRRLHPDEPSKAITGGTLSEFLHPTAHRPLTIRECARLQTFPDDFRFLASRRDAIQLIGNAVPPLLAAVFAQQLSKDLAYATPGTKPGALLTFVPTLSSGSSPILKEVTDKVSETFRPVESSGQLSLTWA